MLPQGTQLLEFVRAAKEKGASDEGLVAMLTRRGWAAEAVYTALGDYWATATGVELPVGGTKSESSKEAFFYLLAFSTLCSWSTALGSAMFTFIDQWFPDPVTAANYSYYLDPARTVTWQLATLGVAFPIFLLVMRLILQGSKAQPDRPQSGVQKWLTYLALLGTAGTIIGDLIWFLNSLLAGEITTRFFLKSVVVMVICAGIFIYYLRTLRSARQPTEVDDIRWNRGFVGLSLAAVGTVFAIGIFVAGTPAQQRDYQADERRIEALLNISNAIRMRYENFKLRADSDRKAEPFAMPPSLDSLSLIPEGLMDPVSRQTYEYRVIAGTKYELCAVFARPMREARLEQLGGQFWEHGSGRRCYQLDASRSVVDTVAR